MRRTECRSAAQPRLWEEVELTGRQNAANDNAHPPTEPATQRDPARPPSCGDAERHCTAVALRAVPAPARSVEKGDQSHV